MTDSEIQETTAILSVRIPWSMKKKLKDQADVMNVTLSTLIVRMCAEFTGQQVYKEWKSDD